MKNTDRIRIAALIFALVFAILPVGAAAARPTPTPEPTPIPRVTISTAAEFADFARNCALDVYSRGVIFVLERDIDLTGTDCAPVPYFAGTFEGGGHMIRGLEITGDGSRMGLFRTVAEGGTVRDLRVRGTVTPGGTGEYAGGVAGICAGTLENCSFEGTVSGIGNVGGVAGAVEETGSLAGCSFRGDVTGEHQAGGIVGVNRGLVRDCSSAGNVNTVLITPRKEPGFDLSAFTQDDFLDVANAGGVAGENVGIVTGCVNTGAVGYKNTGYNVGGIAGKSSGFVSGCENRGEVTGRRDVGGVVGQLVPYAVWDLSEGRLDELEKQLGTLSYLIGKASRNADSAVGDLSGTLNGIRGDTQWAVNELQGIFSRYEENQNRLIDRVQRDPETGEITIRPIDLSGISAAGLTSALNSLHARYVSLTADLGDTVSAMTDGLNGVTSQLSRVMTTMFQAINGMSKSGLVTREDLSASETYDHDLGAVEDCRNYGAVTAENNAGGVVGTIGFEVEFDMENTLNASEILTADARESLFAAARGCAGFCAVTALESRAGGAVGSMEMGAAADCIFAGSVTARDGDCAGGAAGYSAGTIRGCWARTVLSGGKYVGGISGQGGEVLDCRSWAHVDSAREYAGAVAGWTEGLVQGNFYVDDAPAGVDGVSLHEQCDPLSAEEMLALDGAPDSFSDITVTFMAEDKTVAEVTVPFGGRVDSLPEVPNDGERYWKWDDFDAENIYCSLTVTGRYYAPGTVLSWGGEPAMFLAEGVFYEGQVLTASPLSVTAEDESILEAYTLQVNDYQGDLTVRMRTDREGELYRVLDDGTRTRLTYRSDGQYIVFDLPNGGAFVYTPRESAPALPAWAIPAGCGLAAALLLVLILARRKKKKAALGEAAGSPPAGAAEAAPDAGPEIPAQEIPDPDSEKKPEPAREESPEPVSGESSETASS